jgi:hypothetical protein
MGLCKLFTKLSNLGFELRHRAASRSYLSRCAVTCFCDPVSKRCFWNRQTQCSVFECQALRQDQPYEAPVYMFLNAS